LPTEAGGDSWMPDVTCGDADSATQPTTYTEQLLYDDILALMNWTASDQCRFLCEPNGCFVSPGGTDHIYYKCGDGKTLAGFEECDDGNNTGGDGCGPFCLTEN
jgi:cysteine-rich repeat protein